MKTMTISIKGMNKILTGKMLAFAIAGMLALPVAAYSQDRESGDGAQEEMEAPSSTSSGPWQNSAGSTIGTRDNTPTVGNATTRPAADPRLGPGGGSLSRGAVGDGRGPGGNPDVPFDTNMNLAFLLAGIVFAFIVVRKKLRLKAVPVQNK